jgi:DNA-binding XRE family transcriptional regulator
MYNFLGSKTNLYLLEKMRPEIKSYKEKRIRAMGQKLREARLEAGWTQKEVAKYLGYSRFHMVRVEQGLNILDLPEMELLADAFGVPVCNITQRD